MHRTNARTEYSPRYSRAYTSRSECVITVLQLDNARCVLSRAERTERRVKKIKTTVKGIKISRAIKKKKNQN